MTHTSPTESPVSVFRDIPGYPGYSVNREGHITGLRGRLLKPARTPRGYKYIGATVNGKRSYLYVHRAVLLAWIGPCPEGQEACHGDGDPDNNRLSNLRWDTSKANGQDSVRHGTSNRGTRNGSSSLTEGEVRAIRRMLALGHSQKRIASAFDVNQSTVSMISTGRRWSHVS